jgi:hypothetical protein
MTPGGLPGITILSMRHLTAVGVLVCLLAIAAAARALEEQGPSTKPSKLPKATSKYNRGDAPGRYRDQSGHVRRFQLRQPTSIYDGDGHAIGQVTEPVMLNVGVAKDIDVGRSGTSQSFAWAWDTPAGSGWIARKDLVDAPKPDADPTRNPKPPGESTQPLTIDCAAGRGKLKGLRHVNSDGVIPEGGGNKGEHYAGRSPGDHDYVYLLLACPNVVRGGVAKDSISNGSHFVEALDADGKPIVEEMTMYRDGDLAKPVKVTFVYGRTATSNGWGWLARANVGEL